MTILAISGSLRKDSYNSALLRAFKSLAPRSMEISMADISSLPLYNNDDEAVFPTSAQMLKDAIIAADGLIIATPEYNRSIPGALKNAIDWASRPYGQNAFAGKPVLVAGVSSGKIGTAVAQSHLRQILLYLEANVIGQPELYLGPAKEIFNEQYAITHPATAEKLTEALTALSKRVG